MYPDFQYLLQGLTGLPMPAWLGLFKTFGLMVALAFLGAAWATGQELKRKARAGLLHAEYRKMVVGKPASVGDLLFSVVVGFVLGFKVGGVMGHLADVSPDPMGYLLSGSGNLMIGIAGAAVSGIWQYLEKKKQQLPEPQIKTMKVFPHDMMMEIIMVAAVCGLVGAKIFNALETWDDFVKDPIRNLTSSSGLTFLGGLIVATAGFYFFCRKHHIPFKHMCDAAAPGIMLAYGIGRLGCQLSGDGDWGIYNTAYITTPDGSLRAALPADHVYTMHAIGFTDHAFVQAPGWLPRWLFAMNYPHNVGHEGMTIQGCVGEYCSVLPVSVFPTPVYEAVTCILLFWLLWRLRSRLSGTLKMFGAYLILVGVERFLVELIRVNYKYDLGFIHPTQAEIISVLLVIGGAWLLLFYKDKSPAPQPVPLEDLPPDEGN